MKILFKIAIFFFLFINVANADLVKPKFEVAFQALDSLSSEIGSYKKPTGGYFISYNTN